MRQCEIERVVPSETNFGKFQKTGYRKVCWIDGIEDLEGGTIIDLKKLPGYWVLNEVFDQEKEVHELNRNWHVGGL